MGRQSGAQGPSPNELRLRAELDRTRRELAKLKKAAAAALQTAAPPAAAPQPGAPQPGAPAGPSAAEAALQQAKPGSPEEVEALRKLVGELTATRQRLSRLYFSQVEDKRKREGRMQRVVESVAQISSELDFDTLLARITGTLQTVIGFQVVLVRIREGGSDRLQARAFAGVDEAGIAALTASDVPVEEFRSWLRDEFRVRRSYFISHRHEFSKQLPAGYRRSLGPREEWEWHEDDVLFVPLLNRQGELMGYFSVDDPTDRLVPSTETIELLEIVANHAAIAIENAWLYRALEGQANQLRASGQRMQELHALKSTFVSTVSHELRTPLTAMRAFLETMLAVPEGQIPQDRLRHFLGIMNEETQRLARLVESVLDLNRLDSTELRLERQPVDLGEVARETVALLGPVAETGQVNLKLANDCADSHMEADPDQMRQLLLHLGSNAVKFTPAGGDVTVRLTGTPDEITLQVDDTGIGIPQEALGRVFERFYQVDSSLARRYGGAGLGLAISKSIVEWHGGRIAVESVPGRGSCFTVVLPRRSGPRVAVHPDPTAPAASEDLLRLGIEMVAEVMDARVVSLLTPGPGGDLQVRAAIGLDERVVSETRIPVGTGVSGWVAKNRRPLCVANAQESSEIAGNASERYRTRTFISVPLEGESGLLGVLNVTDPVSDQPFDAQDCELLLQLAERVVATWATVRRAGEGGDDAEKAARTLRRVLSHLERRRQEAPHRVKLARALAQELGLDEAEVATIAFAASVHDVGMTRLPGSLRDSGAPFSAEERAMMERHVELGAEALEPLEAVGVVREIVLSHHEWWDGTGYPRGLREEEIPVGARVLAVVDAWESMTVGRTHQPARSEDDARRELRRLAGRQFDPRVVDAFECVAATVPRAPAPADPPSAQDANAIAGR